MDYLKIYDSLINDAKTNPQLETYKELHHIVPRCLGGSNEKDNLVYLTARQHFIAHWLLYKIYGGSKLANAWYAMCRVGHGQGARRVNSAYYKYAKETRSRYLSEESLGIKNHFFGKKHSIESRNKMSNTHKKNMCWLNFSDSHKAALRASQQKPKTSEHKAKIGKKGLVMLQNIYTLEIIRVAKNDERVYSKEWVNPKKITPEQKFKCYYCDVITTKGNLKRWHNDNCKQKRLDQSQESG